MRVRFIQKSPNRLGVLILPRHTMSSYEMATEADQDLDVDRGRSAPLTLLSSQAILPLDSDDLEVAGALHRAPLEFVRCTGSEIEAV